VNTLKVKNHKNLVRDSRTKAILNTDIILLKKREREKRTDVTLESLRDEVSVIRSEFTEIKNLLNQIVAKRQ
jgi:hypothetical protein